MTAEIFAALSPTCDVQHWCKGATGVRGR